MTRALAALALLVVVIGYSPEPADAAVLQPGQLIVHSHNVCSADAFYGTYGLGFAQLHFRSGSGTCNGWTAVQAVTSAGNGPWCNLIDVVFGNPPTSGCTFLFDAATGIQSARSGTGWGLRVQLCVDGPGPVQGCRTFTDSVFG